MNTNLKNILDEKKLKEVCAVGPESLYLCYKIKKSNGGSRTISAPQEPLKSLQHEILHKILYIKDPHESSIGFIPGASITDGADKHVGSKAILNLDLKDFFHSVKYDKIISIMLSIGEHINRNLFSKSLSSKDMSILARLVSFKYCLPQGAPTSPYLSNLAAYSMDDGLSEYAEKNNLVYTRYADDMSFSHATGDIDMLKVYKDILPIIEEKNFKVNKRKTRILRDHQRMTVTGIVINDKKGVPKWKWKNFRAELHNLLKSGKTISEDKHQQLLGYAQWLKQLNAKKAEPYLKQIGKIPYKRSSN